MAIIFQQGTTNLESGTFTVRSETDATVAAYTAYAMTLQIKIGNTFVDVQQYDQASGTVKAATLLSVAATDINVHKITSPGVYRLRRAVAGVNDEAVVYTE